MLQFGCNFAYTNKNWEKEKETIEYNDETESCVSTSQYGDSYVAPRPRKTKSTKFDDGEV